jgi:hypothetical protein
MLNLAQVFSQSDSSAENGVFKTIEELNAYEKMWHRDIYQPTWDNIKAKVVLVTQSLLVSSYIMYTYLQFVEFSSEQSEQSKNMKLNDIRYTSIQIVCCSS